jgi:hypothetical protein
MPNGGRKPVSGERRGTGGREKREARPAFGEPRAPLGVCPSCRHVSSRCATPCGCWSIPTPAAEPPRRSSRSTRSPSAIDDSAQIGWKVHQHAGGGRGAVGEISITGIDTAEGVRTDRARPLPARPLPMTARGHVPRGEGWTRSRGAKTRRLRHATRRWATEAHARRNRVQSSGVGAARFSAEDPRSASRVVRLGARGLGMALPGAD